MNVSNGTSTLDGEQLCQIILKCINNCRSFLLDKNLTFKCDLDLAVIILGHCAIGANLLPMVHENITYGPKWPVKILVGAKFYHDCAEIKNKKRHLSVFDTSMLQEIFTGKYL